jgi:hypothetical protein
MTDKGRRGHCADCGYAAYIQPDGTVPPHVVRRINRQGNPYQGLAVGDDACTGAGRPPEPLPRVRRTERGVKRAA